MKPTRHPAQLLLIDQDRSYRTSIASRLQRTFAQLVQLPCLSASDRVPCKLGSSLVICDTHPNTISAEYIPYLIRESHAVLLLHQGQAASFVTHHCDGRQFYSLDKSMDLEHLLSICEMLIQVITCQHSAPDNRSLQRLPHWIMAPPSPTSADTLH